MYFLYADGAFREKKDGKKTKEGKKKSPEKSAWNQKGEGVCRKEEVDYCLVVCTELAM